MLAQIAELDAQGFTQERYAELRETYRDWNWGVIDHSWKLATGPCALCTSFDPGVLVAQTLICFRCLNQQPLVPWHPTGDIRPRVPAFLQHAKSCDQH